MSDLEAAIAAEMRLAGCRRGQFACTVHTWRGGFGGVVFWDREQIWCPEVASVVRAGWDAAINAAAEAIGEKHPGWGVTTDYDQGFLDGWDDHQTAVGREVRSLLSEGGDRD